MAKLVYWDSVGCKDCDTNAGITPDPEWVAKQRAVWNPRHIDSYLAPVEKDKEMICGYLSPLRPRK